MTPLQDSSIERPASLFEVELLVHGAISGNTIRRTISVLAETSRGARQICTTRYAPAHTMADAEANAVRGHASVGMARKAGNWPMGRFMGDTEISVTSST